MMENEEIEYISVSEYAKRLGVSQQTIRNRIDDGLIKTIKFQRGKMNGVLCAVKKEEKDNS